MKGYVDNRRTVVTISHITMVRYGFGAPTHQTSHVSTTWFSQVIQVYRAVIWTTSKVPLKKNFLLRRYQSFDENTYWKLEQISTPNCIRPKFEPGQLNFWTHSWLRTSHNLAPSLTALVRNTLWPQELKTLPKLVDDFPWSAKRNRSAQQNKPISRNLYHDHFWNGLGVAMRNIFHDLLRVGVEKLQTLVRASQEHHMRVKLKKKCTFTEWWHA